MHGGETSVHHETFVHSKERYVCDISHIYVTLSEEEEEIYPPTIAQIAEEQRRSRAYKPYFKSKKPKKTKLDRQIFLKVIDIQRYSFEITSDSSFHPSCKRTSWIGIITTYSIQERRDLRNPSKPLCIGQVWLPQYGSTWNLAIVARKARNANGTTD